MQFTPRAEEISGKVIKTIDVSLGRDQAYVKQIIITNLNGDETAISFLNSELNKDLPKTEWDVKQ